MTLAKARELLAVQADMGGGYNRNGARLILAEVQNDHGQEAVDALIREFDLETLSDFMVELKREYPEQESASVLMEAHIPYDYLIQVMDIVRSVEVPAELEGEYELVALFSEISVGDAP